MSILDNAQLKMHRNRKIVIFPIEPLETRYTSEWYEHLPRAIEKHADELETCVEIIVVGGEMPNAAEVTEGAFLNFVDTNVYKSSQLINFTKRVLPALEDDDVILFTDAWNPCAVQVKYMLSLMGKKTKMFGMWHAGSYDPNDFLGRAFDKKWSFNFERSLYYVYDENLFATEYHKRLFKQMTPDQTRPARSRVVGWPMEYLTETLPSKNVEKKNLIVFPHRISQEKRPDVFDRIAAYMSGSGYSFVKAQDLKLSKPQYHELLAQAKLVFSASEQETLGIGVYEGMLSGALPIMPDRLSYHEIFLSKCHLLYQAPSEWTDEDIAWMCNTIIQPWMEQDERREEQVRAMQVDARIHGYYNGRQLYNRLITSK